jgi:dipeptidyl aminopeptidase/acylaminoacyl peptidase
MKTFLAALAAALILPSISAAQAPRTAAESVAGTSVIPRSALFGNPEKTQGRLSPDGKYVSFIAPRDGVLNVWLAERGKLDDARPITHDQKRGIRQHFWAFDNKHVLFIQDEGGDENFHLYAVDVVTGTQKDLTPYPGVRAEIAGLSWKKPGVIAVGINDRKPEWHDLYEVDLNTGKRVLVLENTQEFSAYNLDFDLKPRIASKNDAEGTELLRRVGDKWVSMLRIGQADSLTSGVVGVEFSGKTALLQSSVGRDKAALERVDLATGKTTLIASSDQADLEDLWLEPKTFKVQAYIVNYLKPEITVVDPSVKKDVDYLTQELGDGCSVGNRTLDDALAPASTYIYDRKAGKVTKLFDHRPALSKAALVPMQSLELKARDGLTLISYLSLPPGSDTNGDNIPDSPVPLVLVVHGGPWARDTYGFDNEHQWLHRFRQELHQRVQQGVGRQDA